MKVVAARVSIAAVLTYQALLAALIVIRPELDPSWQTISVYALGRLGWIMVLAFLVSALSYAALVVAVAGDVGGAVGRVGLGLLVGCVAGTVGVGLFRTDPITASPGEGTTVGALHTAFGSTALVLLPFAALLINLSLARRNAGWAVARRPLLWTAGLPLLAFVVHAVWVAAELPPDGRLGPGVDVGWPARLLLLGYMVWLVVLAAQVIRVARTRTVPDGMGAAVGVR
jgi:hypothetical protein